MIEEIQRISIGGEQRYKGILSGKKEEKSLRSIINEISSSKVILWGGEPTLRRDILQLLQQSKEKTSWLCFRTDGMIFQKPKQVKQLKRAGLDAVIIPIPSLQSDLNRWILGKGFTKKALQAMKLAQMLDIEVFAEILVTRSGMDRIAQTFLGLVQQGVDRIIVRCIEAEDVDVNLQLSVLPRISLLEQELRTVLLMAKQEKVSVFLEGLSSFDLQNDLFTEWKFSDRTYLSFRNKYYKKCFVPRSYIEQFGWTEFYREEIEITEIPFQMIEIRSEDRSNVIRQHLVQISQTKPLELQILGDFRHEKLYSILRDALRLGIPEIWLIGDLEALLSISKMEWFRLKDIKGLGHVITQPEISSDISKLFERTKRFEQRIYAQVNSVKEILLYDRMFAEGVLPFAPYFILKDDWNIQDIFDVMKNLSPESKEKLEELIPFCLGSGVPQRKRFNLWRGIRDRERKSLWSIFPKIVPCPKKEDCVAFVKCCGIMKGWEEKVQPIIEEVGSKK